MTLDEILSDLYLRLHTADEARDLIDGIMWREITAHVSAEREVCAQVCDEYAANSSNPMNFSENCAAAIRARGEK